MAKQLVNIGTTANDGTGDPIRDAFDKVNDNFTELYQALGDDTDLGFTLDSDGNIDITNNLNVSGGLAVTGNTTLNGETITIGDGSDGATTVNGATLTINPSTTVDDNLTVNGDFAVNTDTLFVDVSADRVGIGTDSPANNVHIKGDANGEGLTIQRASSASGAYADLMFSISTSDSAAPNAKIRATRGTDYADTDISIITNDSEAMRIDSDGNVGIGETSPDSVLHIKNNTPTITLEDANLTDVDCKILANNGNLGLVADSANQNADSIIYFTVDTTERMRIDSDGVVTVGGHTHTAQGVQTITTTSGTINLDASTYGVFRLTSDLTGTTYLNLQNMKDGQVIDITVSGSQTIHLQSDDTSETFNKVGGVDYDGASDNHIQVICIDATDSAAIYNYTIGTFESDTTP